MVYKKCIFSTFWAIASDSLVSILNSPMISTSHRLTNCRAYYLLIRKLFLTATAQEFNIFTDCLNICDSY
ncbi:hypothetical protein D3C81_1770850 [compost metagenome]